MIMNGPSLTMRFTGRRQAMQTSGTLQASSHPLRVAAPADFRSPELGVLPLLADQVTPTFR